ncbi:MAG: endopeptidase La [Ignavibacteria bacterium]|nr:endopeptidase La [Ignavibacteria bacterium]
MENTDTQMELKSELAEINNRLPVLPLRDVVIYPYMVYPVLVGRETSMRAANYANDSHKLIFLVAQKDPKIEEPKPEDLYQEGTVARIVQILKLPNGLLKIIVDGLAQGIIKSFTDNTSFLEAEVEIITHEVEETPEIDALVRHTSNLFHEYITLSRNIPDEVYAAFKNLTDPVRKLYFVAANIQQSLEVKQSILRELSLKDKFYRLIKILNSEIDVLKIEKEIDQKVQENIQKAQRKFLIQEQIRILQDELGEDEEISPEFQKLRDKIKKARMPKDVEEKALEELNRLKKTPPMSPEATVIRNYLDWLIDVPWKKRTKDNLDLEHVRKILDEDHFGLEKPKERILEHIAVLNLVKEMRGQILCFSGPPGVGKTSLAKSIARALGRKFVRISLGGVRDEAEIRGHRRTYIGSMPGKIIQSMKKAGVINPVMLLDEIDKMSMDFRGDPSAAMLEVLDPEQNHAFNDHYLDVDYDLSKVLFITTANVRYNIPLPLQDRMEIIELPGYLEYEKLEIAKRHIIPKQLKEHGLENFDIKINDDAILRIIREYTREAGVRNLEREIASILRKVAKDIALEKSKNKNIDKVSRIIDAKNLETYLGVPKFKAKKISAENRIGTAIGLAWTSVGGDILNVEVTIMDGPEKFTLTGQLGDVMKESAQAALSYIRSNAKVLGIDPHFYRGKEIHIHLPEGAIPKDGPSAGITMTMAMISAIKKIPVRIDVAMTGEITLRGNVLPIGGLTEKLLAAQRYGIKKVLIPKENLTDLADIPETVKKPLKIIPIETILEAIPHVFENFDLKLDTKNQNLKSKTKSTKTNAKSKSKKRK